MFIATRLTFTLLVAFVCATFFADNFADGYVRLPPFMRPLAIVSAGVVGAFMTWLLFDLLNFPPYPPKDRGRRFRWH